MEKCIDPIIVYKKQTTNHLFKKKILSLLIIFFSCVHAIAQSYYPAGLGNTNLKLWLTAADPTSLINPSSAQAADGNFIAKWIDKSGAGAHAVQATSGNQPIYKTNQLNGFGGVLFQNSSEYLTGPTGSYQTIIAVRSMIGTTGTHYQYLFSAPANTDFSIRGAGSGTNTSYTDGPNANDWCFATGLSPAMFINDVQSLTGTAGTHILAVASANPTNATYSISSTFAGRGMYANDPVYELIAYNNAPSITQRRLLENYEASEWGLTSLLPTTGFTAFAPASATTFNKNLVGIGSTGLLDYFLANPAGSTDGLGLSSGNGLTDFLSSLSTGFIMAAHNGQANTILLNANINNVAGNTNIWNRSWLLQKNNGYANGAVTLNFNFNDYNGTSPSNLYSYGILYNATSGTFTSGTNIVVATTSTTVSGNIVSFALNAANLSNGYYTLIWSQFGPLAITLRDFEVTRENKNSLLQWTTAQEKNSNYFEVQHASDGANFIAFATVKSKGNSSINTTYKFIDTKLFNGWNYYRLKMINDDGTVTYSEIKSIYFDDLNKSNFEIYPNPVNDVLHISSSVNGNINVQIINTSGQVIKSYNTELASTSSIPVNYLSKGIYFIRITNNTSTTVQKIIKQ
jgi:hypothetical protein